jgi:hypothetical protein
LHHDPPRAAKKLGVTEEWLHEIHTMMDPSDGAVWIDDGTEHGTPGFTEVGMENLIEDMDRFPPKASDGS